MCCYVNFVSPLPDVAVRACALKDSYSILADLAVPVNVSGCPNHISAVSAVAVGV